MVYLILNKDLEEISNEIKEMIKKTEYNIMSNNFLIFNQIKNKAVNK